MSGENADLNSCAVSNQFGVGIICNKTEKRCDEISSDDSCNNVMLTTLSSTNCLNLVIDVELHGTESSCRHVKRKLHKGKYVDRNIICSDPFVNSPKRSCGNYLVSSKVPSYSRSIADKGNETQIRNKLDVSHMYSSSAPVDDFQRLLDKGKNKAKSEVIKKANSLCERYSINVRDEVYNPYCSRIVSKYSNSSSESTEKSTTYGQVSQELYKLTFSATNDNKFCYEQVNVNEDDSNILTNNSLSALNCSVSFSDVCIKSVPPSLSDYNRSEIGNFPSSCISDLTEYFSDTILNYCSKKEIIIYSCKSSLGISTNTKEFHNRPGLNWHRKINTVGTRKCSQIRFNNATFITASSKDYNYSNFLPCSGNSNRGVSVLDITSEAEIHKYFSNEDSWESLDSENFFDKVNSHRSYDNTSMREKLGNVFIPDEEDVSMDLTHSKSHLIRNGRSHFEESLMLDENNFISDSDFFREEMLNKLGYNSLDDGNNSQKAVQVLYPVMTQRRSYLSYNVTENLIDSNTDEISSSLCRLQEYTEEFPEQWEVLDEHDYIQSDIELREIDYQNNKGYVWAKEHLIDINNFITKHSRKKVRIDNEMDIKTILKDTKFKKEVINILERFLKENFVITSKCKNFDVYIVPKDRLNSEELKHNKNHDNDVDKTVSHSFYSIPSNSISRLEFSENNFGNSYKRNNSISNYKNKIDKQSIIAIQSETLCKFTENNRFYSMSMLEMGTADVPVDKFVDEDDQLIKDSLDYIKCTMQSKTHLRPPSKTNLLTNCIPDLNDRNENDNLHETTCHRTKETRSKRKCKKHRIKDCNLLSELNEFKQILDQVERKQDALLQFFTEDPCGFMFTFPDD